MKRVAIFAHYDSQNKIDDYVRFYLEQLKKCVAEIIFISDGKLAEAEESSIRNLVTHVIAKRHGEYDFGSYKRGFDHLVCNNLLSDIDEIIFANDSCYCLRGFDEVFKKMQGRECDAWGMTEGYPHCEQFGNRYHLQSFFLVLRRGVFLEKFFQDFILGVIKQNEKRDIIIQYEEGLSSLLIGRKKKLLSAFSMSEINDFCNSNKSELNKLLRSLKLKKNNLKFARGNLFNPLEKNPSHRERFYLLLRMGCPLVKKNILREDTSRSVVLTYFWQKIFEEIVTDNRVLKLIKNHSERLNFSLKKPALLTKKLFGKKPERSLYSFLRSWLGLSAN